jgi:polyhydroxyalkanoate depolymerase
MPISWHRCIGNREGVVTEEPLAVTPFGTLLRFRKDVETPQPRVLVVAPLSGHFATLLRGLVYTMLPEHDVCITDWHNARDIGTVHGCFGFDAYIEKSPTCPCTKPCSSRRRMR